MAMGVFSVPFDQKFHAVVFLLNLERIGTLKLFLRVYTEEADESIERKYLPLFAASLKEAKILKTKLYEIQSEV
jgi:hypothetical protein